MPSPHLECIHHENHAARIGRNETDIQDLFLLVEKIEKSVFRIVGGIQLVGVIVMIIVNVIF